MPLGRRKFVLHGFICCNRPQLCNWPHILGLYKLNGAGGHALSSLSMRTAAADLLLWAIARIQTRVFASQTYGR
jgi:hypothetical protein